MTMTAKFPEETNFRRSVIEEDLRTYFSALFPIYFTTCTLQTPVCILFLSAHHDFIRPERMGASGSL